ncbi:HAMP domain-containing sensor histidine kinase [Planococcus shenhongbingii]|uniref:histidine kinase n=1 Tax=Planococcus shenhongbingii TaxID=3058398 RepID=A0ABT8N9K0_9BACL|nr:MULTISPECIES: HAMP domain-containing sensor histidine kinase [unclassified Planococcus (in: firmicutes)]MDN7244369.1 HAMP domain-containing sensor histidine kinase [Planococcus sp. N017]WKA57536.1 HAMP domain-containing sensor histidine kinase [Planococcus sp. N016]
MKLKNKIHIWTTLLMLVILLVLMTVIYFSFSRLTYSSEVTQLRTEASVVVTKLNETSTEDPRTVLRGYVPVNGSIQVNRNGNELIPTIQDPSVQTELPADLPEASGTIQVEDELFVYVTTPVIWTDGEVANLTIAQSMREVTGNLQTLRLVLITVTVLAMIPVVISSIVLGRIITKPITDLTNTMTRIQRNGKFEKLQTAGETNDEIGQMGQTFNEMMALLEENYTKQEEFVSNASHELKTPLTVIGSYAKLLQRQGMRDEKIAGEGLTAIRNETDRMKALIEQLLHIARQSESQLEYSKVNIVEVLEQTTAALTTSYNREFLLQTSEPDLFVTTDLAKLKQLLYILLDNARKYSSDRIEVVAKNEGRTLIQIRDYGIGIPKESLPFIFERFYRVDKARSRETGGSGLGLSLARQLADSLGIELEIESIEQMGTTVSIIFSSDFNVGAVQSSQEGL